MTSNTRSGGRDDQRPPCPPCPPGGIEGLPPLEDRGMEVLLRRGGEGVAVASGGRLALYRLCRSGDGWTAELDCEHALGGEVAALAETSSGMVLAASRDADRTWLTLIDDDGARPLAELAGRAVHVAAGRRTAAVALRRPGRAGAAILSVDLRSGETATLADSASAEVELSFGQRGDVLILADRRRGQLNRIALTRPCDDGDREPPKDPRPDPDRPKNPDGTKPGCDCHGTPGTPGGPGAPGGSGTPGGPGTPGDPPRPKDPDCRPGGGWVPGDCHDWIATGHMVIRHPRCDPNEQPCKTRLDFVPGKLTVVGRHLLAVDGKGRRATLLDQANLRTVWNRSFGRRGAAFFAAERAAHFLTYRRDRRVWQAETLVEFAPWQRPFGTFHPAPAESITFHGHNPDGIPPAPDPQLGVKKVLCVPVTEPGQAFTDPDCANFGAFMRPNSFNIVNDYYDETSFGQLDMQIDMFGLDVGPIGKPIVMPNSFRSYFWPPYKAGGMIATEASGANPYEVRLDGTESLTLKVDPRTGPTDDLPVPFCALGLSKSYDPFPVSLNFTGAETADLDVETASGSSFLLHLDFTAAAIDIESGDVQAGLDAVAAYLDGVIAAAEAAAGVPGGDPLFEPVEVRRVKASGQDFGSLDINLRLRPDGAGKGRVDVTGQSGLGLIGFTTPLLGLFSLPTDKNALDAYLERALRQAETDFGYDFATRRFGGTTVGFDNGTGTVTTTLTIETAIGGDGSVISVASQSGLEALGFDNAVTDPGISDPNSANALKDSEGFMDDFFTAIVDRLGGAVPADFFTPYVSVLVGIVGAPPGGEWGAGQPDVAGLRMFTRPRTAKYIPDDSIQLYSRYIGTIFDATPDNATLAHELGHALGLGDLYYLSGFRDDLQYMGGWSMMDSHSNMPHFGGYHKYVLGWLPEARVVPTELPNPMGPTVQDALLVPVEYWDAGMEAAVRAVYPGTVPIGQLISIDLGGDGVQFDLVEARQAGVNYSKSLPSGTGLLVTNAIDPADDTRYAEANLYRRKQHRLNTGSDLQAAGDSFDLAAAPELPAVGVSVEVIDVRDVIRPSATVKVFHTRVTREQADYVDLCFTEATPVYKCVDVWVDWAGDNPSADPADHHVYPEGEPQDQGEVVHYPAGGTELHWVVGRVHNRGTAPAKNVKINASKWDPPGAGDTGKKAIFRSATIDEVPAGGFVTIPLRWDVGAAEHEHQCMRLDIADWELPDDPVTAIALASDDVWLSNNWGQKNVFDFVALGASPYAPIAYDFSVTNEGVKPERAYLEPEGLAPGLKLTVTPRRRVIAPKETAIFKCLLELDDKVIDAGCRNDRAFVLWAWRENDESCERWGGCKYTVRPRKKTETRLAAWWGFDGVIPVSGGVSPDPGGGSVLVRVGFDGGEGTWRRIPLAAGGTFAFDLKSGKAKSAELVAHFEGSGDFGPSDSPLVKIEEPEPVG